MTGDGFSKKIAGLFRQGRWKDARALLERERETHPDNHWLLTQLGVTFYEQRQYDEALRLFRESYEILDDCPLTLWNLAGTLDALGEYKTPVAIYTWLIKSAKSPADDSCWESKAWTDRLKTDCVFRLGVCFQKRGRKSVARHCFRQYLDLLSIGIDGTYSAEEVLRRLHELSESRENAVTAGRIDKALKSALEKVEGGKAKGRLGKLTNLKRVHPSKRAVASSG